MVMVTYDIDPKDGGLVIGKGGSDLRALQAMRGVQNIRFDTKSSKRIYKLAVTAVNRAACDAVYDVIQRKIERRASLLKNPEVARTFIDVNDKSLDVITLRRYGSRGDEAVVVIERGDGRFGNFIISSFSRGSVVDAIDVNSRDSSQVRSNFMEFMETNVCKAFQEALENHKSSSDEVLDFHVSPGKVIFTGQSLWATSLSRSKVTGPNGVSYLTEKGLKTFFMPYLNPKYIDLLNKKLTELEFENLNTGCPETYTTVHLAVIVGSDTISFSAILALDENLETLKAPSDDPRLSEEKKKKIERVISARTIGDVLGLSTSSAKAKIAYFKLARDLHPDKNQHPGASEAFKKLLDAYEKINKGFPLSTPALPVTVESNEEKRKVPPKVVKVKTKRIRMCVITTLSAKELDMRASLKGYEKDKNNLTGHVRETLNACWDRRDAAGRIRAVSGSSDIYVTSVKQVLELYTWIKEVPYVSIDGNNTAIVEIKMKKLREKAGQEVNWKDSVEVDFNLNTGARNEMTGEELASEMMELKKWIERILL